MDNALVSCFDPILRSELPKFSFTNPPRDPIELAHELVEAMLAEGGQGLSANQIGLPYRVFAIASHPCLVCFNPILLDASTDTNLLDEGCLSFPGVSVKVKRPAIIKVRFTQPNGEVTTEKYGGMTARVFQHELDHLNGITFLERASIVQREKALKQMKKLSRKKERTVATQTSN
jgi:peptide deformylase